MRRACRSETPSVVDGVTVLGVSSLLREELLRVRRVEYLLMGCLGVGRRSLWWLRGERVGRFSSGILYGFFF
jgi:hypothetical protein